MVRVFLVLGHGIPGDALLSGFSMLAFLTMIAEPPRAPAAEREADAGLLLHLPRRYSWWAWPRCSCGAGRRRRGARVTALAAGATPDPRRRSRASSSTCWPTP
jgi:hypothetical protein